MRRLLSIVFVATFVAASAQAKSKIDRLAGLAGDCLTEIFVGCDTETHGTLETGDCTTGDGRRVDFFAFNGTAGQLIEVMVRPLSTTYKEPVVALFSPLGDVADPPSIGGGNPSATTSGASLFYQLSSTGTWDIAVTSDDLFASGPYVLHVYCGVGDTSTPQSCVDQYLLCGQTGIWELSADSCRFQNDPSAFVRWWVYGVKNDILRLEQSSFSFTPLIGLYDEDAKLLGSSTRDSSFTAKMTFRVPETGWYQILTTSEEDNKGGDFTVSLECSGSGCTWPYLNSPTPNLTVPRRGDFATIPFTVNAVGGFFTTLLDVNGQAVATVGPGSTSITAPPVLRPTTYSLSFSNACGEWISDAFQIAPEPTRRRSVRK
ncbi:MAG TPA: hypothetical protein VEK79_04315 [Thermoanaerobaculia bacterium]|nr:hypothetical protein [Thermoanaerobaculia bacterium]